MNNVIVQGATGINSVTTWMDYTLPGNIQNLTVTGDGLYAAGNALDNLIKVGDTANMQLYGAGGNNVLVGGTGNDTFIVDSTAGSNAIYGWHAGDVLRLDGSNLTSFAAVHAAMKQVGSDVEFDTGSDHVVVRDATIGEFTAASFDLALNKSLLGAMTFDDEFNTLSLRSASNPTGTWTPNYWYGGVGAYTLTGNGELQLYTAPGFTGSGSQNLGLNPFSINNGVLDIHAQAVSATDSAAMWGYGYSSGVITTKDSFAQTYGYFEMKAELPTNVSGAWPAFWLVPADGSWPPELDVMETLSGTPNVDYTTVHTAQGGSPSAVGAANLVTDAGGYHTYGVLWTATQLVWYLDGQEVFATATPADMHQPMYMIANMAVGGWAGTPNFTSADMDIDYIHAYALADGSTTYTSEVVAAAPTTGTSSTTTSTGASTQTSTTTGATASNGGSTTAGNTSTTSVTVSNAVYVAAPTVRDITLTGSGQTVTGNAAGDVFHSNNTSGNHLIGGAGNDTFDLGRGGDSAVSGGGTDTFVLAELPWSSGHITGFTGQDTLDVLPMFDRYGYTGSNPLADGHLKLVADGVGGTQVWAVMDGLNGISGTWLLTTIDNMAVANLAWENGKLIDPPTTGVSTPTPTPSPTPTPTPTATPTSTGGHTFVSDNNGDHWVGTSGNDTFILGRGGDVVSGGGGNDAFVFNETPWTAGHITDFNPLLDTVNLTGLLAASGYTGSNPVADGYLKIVSDAHGSTQIWSNLDSVSAGLGWWLVTTLDGVDPSALSLVGGVIGSVPAISTAAATLALAAGVTDVTLTGSGQTVTGNATGDTFHSNDSGNHLIGGAGADTFILGRGGDVVTGGGGNDIFVFNQTPWAAGHITDFDPTHDILDLSGLLAASGYTGSNPVADGYLKIVSDAHGSTQIWSNLDPVSPGIGWWLVTTLDGVATSAVAIENGKVGEAPVTTSAASYTAAGGVTDITLTGSGETVTGNAHGDVFHSNNSGNHLIGGAGADTFILGRGGDTATGGGGNDTFVFNETPWASGHITDFTPGHDTLDLTGLLAASGYRGSDAVHDGYLKIVDDGHGDTQVWSNLSPSSAGMGWWEVTTLDGVAASQVHLHGAFITG